MVYTRFVVMGDMPYDETPIGGKDSWQTFTHLINEISALSLPPQFTVHVGDLVYDKPSPQYLSEIKKQFFRLASPWVYTPGDNEWIDCFRGRKYLDVYHHYLANLRNILFLERNCLDNFFRLPQWQSQGFPLENFRWRYPQSNVIFLSLHIVYWQEEFFRQIRDIPWQESIPKNEFLLRSRYNIEWLRATVEEAKREAVKAIVMFAQAAPKSGPHTPALNDTVGVREFFEELYRLAQENPHIHFLYIHGDSHPYKPIGPMYPGKYDLDNLKSLSVPGHPDIRAVVLDIEEDREAVNFSSKLIGPGTNW